MVAAAQYDDVSSQKMDFETSSSTPLVNDATLPKQAPSRDNAGNENGIRVAEAVVQKIVEDVSVATSLEKEKEKVQRLITGLVSRVRKETESQMNGKEPPSTSGGTNLGGDEKTEENRATMTNEKGIPENDYRTYRAQRLANLPIEWSQTRYAVTLHIHVPAWVTKRHVRAKFDTTKLALYVWNENKTGMFISVERKLCNDIDFDGSIWGLDAHASTLLVELEKGNTAWWPTLFGDDDPTSYQVVDESANHVASSDLTVLSTTEVEADANGSSQVVTGSTTEEKQNDVGEEIEEIEEIDVSHDGTNGLKQEEPLNSSDERSLPLENVVANVVEAVVTEASDKTEEKKKNQVDEFSGVGNQKSANGEESEDEIQPGKVTPKKTGATTKGRQILTRADLPKLIEESKATVERGGRAAAEAAIQLGTFYHYGIGVVQNDAEAAKLFKIGLNGGVKDGSAAFQLGLIYNVGAPGIEANASEAVKWWTLAAEYGNAVAMFNLGVLMMNGSGCDMDPVQAMRWFERAKLLDKKLEVPQLSRAQLNQRIELAKKLRKERLRQQVTPEEWKKRKEEALKTVRYIGYTSLGLVGLGISFVALRYWMRNRL